jgi:hypothetical protein
MRWRAMNVLAGLSLVACVGVGALWVRSYYRTDTVLVVELAEKGVPRKLRTWSASSAVGCVELGVQQDAWYVDPEGGLPETGFGMFGIRVRRIRRRSR